MDKKQKNILYVYDARFLSGLKWVLLNILSSISRKNFVPYFMGSRWGDGNFIKTARKSCVTRLKSVREKFDL